MVELFTKVEIIIQLYQQHVFHLNLCLLQVVSHFYKVLKEARSGEESWKESYENLLSGVEIFEKEITRRDSQFYGGDYHEFLKKYMNEQTLVLRGLSMFHIFRNLHNIPLNS